jgi:DeoR family fructose operon transcriptional repressor
MDMEAWESFEPAELCKRKYLTCTEFTEGDIRHLAETLTGELFELQARDIERVKEQISAKTEQADVIGEADRFMRSIADEIRIVVHPYREGNPLAVEDLYRSLHGLDQVADFTLEQFMSILTRLEQQHLLTGLNYDGDEIFVEEEYYSWKVSSYTETKLRIAKAAAKRVHSGDSIALDAGSTTEAIAQQLAKSIRLHKLTELTVVTNSLPAATDLLTAANEVGLEDDSRVLRVFLAGGRVRLNTLALVGISDDAGEELARYLDYIGGATHSFVGTNGICSRGYTTSFKSESDTKRVLLEAGSKRCIVTDPSKFGIEQEYAFSLFDGIDVLTTEEGFEEVLERFSTIILDGGGTLTYA